MSGPEQVFFLVIVPGVIVAVIWVLAAISGPKAKKRYRPGRPYEFVPVWYVANHRGESMTDQPPPRDELTASDMPEGGEALQGTTGGASERW